MRKLCKKRAMLTKDELFKNLSYDEITGIFYWEITSGPVRIGDIAGHHDTNGYITITMKGTSYLAHRLAWLAVKGEMPPTGIDHINGVRDDNRICNIRLATPQQNAMNRTAAPNSQTGLRGISFAKGKWVPRISISGKNVHLGRFFTRGEAIAVYNHNVKRIFGEYARLLDD